MAIKIFKILFFQNQSAQKFSANNHADILTDNFPRSTATTIRQKLVEFLSERIFLRFLHEIYILILWQIISHGLQQRQNSDILTSTFPRSCKGCRWQELNHFSLVRTCLVLFDHFCIKRKFLYSDNYFPTVKYSLKFWKSQSFMWKVIFSAFYSKIIQWCSLTRKIFSIKNVDNS